MSSGAAAGVIACEGVADVCTGFCGTRRRVLSALIASVAANSVTAIDAFLLVRKLMKNYGSVLNFFGGKSKKKLKR